MNQERFERYLSICQRTIYHEPDTPNFHNKIIDMILDDVILKESMPSDSIILDIGCGSGYFMQRMVNGGYTNVHGIAYDDQDIQECQTKGLSASKQDFTFTDFPDSHSDFIWCRHAIEHSPFPLFTLMEFNRIAKMGSSVYIEVPAPDVDRKHEWNSNHYSIMGLEMWKALAEYAGFHIKWHYTHNFQLKDEIADGIFVDQNEVFFSLMLTKARELPDV